MAITSLDLYIYQFFEGIRFWPPSVRRWKRERIKRLFEKIDHDLQDVEAEITGIKEEFLFSISLAELADNLNKNKKILSILEDKFETTEFTLSKDVNITKKREGEWIITDKGNEMIYIVREVDRKLNIYKKKKELTEGDKKELIDKSLDLLDETRKFPYNPDEGFYSERCPEEATLFGNVLAEYEGYSEKQYGMHIMVFWPHLWLILPEEQKKSWIYEVQKLISQSIFHLFFSFIHSLEDLVFIFNKIPGSVL